VREHGFTPVQADGVAEAYGKHEIDHGSCREAKGLDLEKDTHG
jgi:hypothetical protein